MTEAEVILGQIALQHGRQFRFHQMGNVAGKHHAQAVLLDRPAHDVEGLRPGMLARTGDAEAGAVGADQRRRRPVAEQGGGDDVAFRQVCATKGQAAQFHHQEQDLGPGARLGDLGGAGQAVDPAGTTQTEDGQTRGFGAERQAFEQAGVERRRGDPRGRYGDQGVHVPGRHARRRKAVLGRFGQQVQGMVEIARVLVRPAARLRKPVQRHAGITGVDARVVESRQHAVDVADPALELAAGPGADIGLGQPVRRHRGAERGQPGQKGCGRLGHHVGPQSGPVRCRAPLTLA